MKLWKLFSDAHTGRLIAMQKGWYNVLGRVYLLDPARTPDATDLESSGVVEDATTLTGPFGSFVNCVSATSDYFGTPDVNSMITEPITPCGSCRQVIAETEKKQGSEIRIIMKGERGVTRIVEGIDSLLPMVFHEEKLKKSGGYVNLTSIYTSSGTGSLIKCFIALSFCSISIKRL